jgi:hypothetical protein
MKVSTFISRSFCTLAISLTLAIWFLPSAYASQVCLTFWRVGNLELVQCTYLSTEAPPYPACGSQSTFYNDLIDALDGSFDPLTGGLYRNVTSPTPNLLWTTNYGGINTNFLSGQFSSSADLRFSGFDMQLTSVVNFGEWRLLGDDPLSPYAGLPYTFNNCALFQKDASQGTSVVSMQFVDNNGTVDVETGVINFASGNVQFNNTKFIGAGQVLVSSNAYFNNISSNTANLVLANGTFTTGSAGLNGQVLWTGGQMSGNFYNFGTLTAAANGQTKLADGCGFYNYGKLQGAGNITGALATVNNFGTLKPGDPFGRMQISGNLNEASSGNIEVFVAGSNPAQFGRVAVGGSLALSGNLQVIVTNGFAAPVGTQLAIISCASRTGVFTQTNIPVGTTLVYTNTGVLLVVTGPVPVQILGPRLNGSYFVFGFNTVMNQSYTIRQNDNLISTNWIFYTNFNGSGAITNISIDISKSPENFYRIDQP